MISNRSYLIFIFFFVLLSIFIRLNQNIKINSLDIELSPPSKLTSFDSFFYTREAKNFYNFNDKIQSEYDLLSDFPENEVKNKKNFNLLAFLLASLGNDRYEVALLLTILLPCLVVVPISLLFINQKIIGIFCCFFTITSAEYIIRTSVGRVDTDLLNLFFCFSLSLCIYRSLKNRQYQYKILAAFFMLQFFFTLGIII